MIDLDDVIYADKINAHLIMQLHDELVYEVKAEEVDVLVNAIKKVVAKGGGLKMNVPTPVNISVGQSFGALVAYNKWDRSSAKRRCVTDPLIDSQANKLPYVK